MLLMSSYSQRFKHWKWPFSTSNLSTCFSNEFDRLHVLEQKCVTQAGSGRQCIKRRTDHSPYTQCLSSASTSMYLIKNLSSGSSPQNPQQPELTLQFHRQSQATTKSISLSSAKPSYTTRSLTYSPKQPSIDKSTT
jgi:hypothetical protein